MNSLLPAPTTDQLRIPLPERRDIWERVCVGIVIPRPPVLRPKDADRRRRAATDLFFFAEQYFPEQFNEPIDYHRAALGKLQEQLLIRESVTFKAVDAAPRGVGKTTLRRIAALWAALYGHEDLIVFLGYKDDNAEPHLKSIKAWLFSNEALHDDFPEVCGWVRRINNDPKRAAPIEWGDDLAQLPNGAWIMARGIKTGVVGLNIEGKRPGFIVLDDYETVETIDSPAITEDIANLVDQQVLKLPGPRKRGVIHMLGTVRTKTCNMYRYTDPEKSPGWEINRLKGLLKPPDREDLWARFVRMAERQEEPGADVCAVPDEAAAAAMGRKLETFQLLQNPGFKHAMRFYALNKAEMDAGAELLDPRHLPLWECYRTIAEEGLKTFQTEIQQEPWADEEAADKREWDVAFIMSHATEYPPLSLPEDCDADLVTLGADVHKNRINYVLRAWRMDGTSWQIEAGISEIYLPGQADQVELDRARAAALDRLHEHARGTWRAGEKTLALALGFVDEGWETNQVRAFCRTTNGLFRPVKGQAGMAAPRFAPNKEYPLTVNLGVYHFKHDLARLLGRTRSKDGIEPGFFHLCDLGASAPGKTHYQSYCRHMTSEAWLPKKNKDGTDVTEYEWRTININNHWWDCEVYAAAAAYLHGVRFVGDAPPPPAVQEYAGRSNDRDRPEGWKIGR